MGYIIICLVALLGSALTFFSGFGLGTLMLPVFGIFFPLPVAISLTAIVHFLNNLFKLFLVGKNIHWKIALSFGLPSIVAALAGAYVLSGLLGMSPVFEYTMGGHAYSIVPVKLVIAVLLIVFSLFELLPTLQNIRFDRKYLPLGGLLSGFFGGLSGHQGALRSAFLLRSGLSKESFIATGVVIACFIDVSRLSVYAGQMQGAAGTIDYTLVGAAALSAFAGAYFGNKLLKKITLNTLQAIVSVFLFVFAVLLAMGIV